MIRLPEIYEEAIVAFARKLDAGEVIDSETETKDKLQAAINEVLVRIPIRDRKAALKLFEKLVDRL